MSRASRTTRVVAAAALALGLSAACGGDDDHDIAAGPTACYLDSKPFVDAVDDDHFATRYNNVELPLERGDASSSIGFQCDISIDGEDVLSLTANFEDQANIKQEDLMAIRTAGRPFIYGKGKGYVVVDADSVHGLWRCKSVRASVSLERSDPDAMNDIEAIVKGLAERAGCSRAS